MHPTIDELFSIACNQQKKIVTDFEMMKNIFSKVDVNKLEIWNFILKIIRTSLNHLQVPMAFLFLIIIML